jgi:hypothetical protein
MKGKPRDELVVNNSLGLDALCQKLQGKDTWNILELGTVRRDNIEFWSRYCDSIHVADLRSCLPLPDSAEDPELPGPEWDRLLHLPEDRHFNVILAWDLFNYLELSAISGLTQYMSRFCRPGTVLFALIFDHPQMPAEIAAYRIVDESHLSYEYANSEMRACPRHRSHDLARALRPFQISNSFLLRNGVVEYLFSYEGAALD